ncbi:c-type cytochrome [Cribrihabitans pelagius]|uniref:c-type cytochrome n=1 Tax=Cribrihabitans pelagius TaxID=1765746 RepID=UPI003B5C59AE
MKLKQIAIAAVAAGTAAGAVWAHGGATGIVKDRMDAMADMGKAMKALTPMMQGKAPYDADAVRAAAGRIGGHAGETMTELFPEGTDGMPSEAKPAIWSNWGEFSALAGQLETLSEGLALAADNGLMMAGSHSTPDMMGGGGMMGGATMMGGSGMQGVSSMMGGAPMHAAPGREELAEMPADGVFTMLSQTCSACHSKFRAEAK